MDRMLGRVPSRVNEFFIGYKLHIPSELLVERFSVQSTYECKTRGEEQWHSPPRGEADVDNASSLPGHDELPCACEAVRASNCQR